MAATRHDIHRLWEKSMPTRRKHAVRKPTAKTVYQFKITLFDSRPTIWRRILIPDGTLDDLHESIQTAMGWTNSHLHQFEIGRKRYGNPELLDDDWSGSKVISSLDTQLGELFGGKRPAKKFHYTYDFGDGWEHLIEFERATSAEAGKKYPCCVDGARACPPEDTGGIWGYAHFLEAIGNPKHEEHETYLEWIGGTFDPEKFSPSAATKAMGKGLPNWRDFR
jgi:Plasmid pRiA4b ORF-3-like protein